MKYIYFVLLIHTFPLLGQLPFTFTTYTETYVDLQDPIILADNEIPFDLDGIVLTQPFNLFGKSFEKFFFIENEIPNLAVGNLEGTKADFFIPLFLPLLNSSPPGIEYSVSYQISGQPGNRIIKIQYKNIRPEENQDLFMNFQIWINENLNYVEFKYGPSSSSSLIKEALDIDELPILTCFVTDSDIDSDTTNIYYLKGESNQPSLFFEPEISELSDLDKVLLTDIPSENTVYRFSYLLSSTSDQKFNDNNSIYWNSLTKILNVITLEDERMISGRLTNIQGQVLYHIGNDKTSLQFEVPQYGIYILTITDAQGKIFSKKLALF